MNTIISFAEYPCMLDGNRNFQLMSHLGRSLYFALKFELWQNDNIPNDHSMIAKILKGFTESEVAIALPEVMWDFSVDGKDIISPALAAQKARAYHRKEMASLAGKKSRKVSEP